MQGASLYCPSNENISSLTDLDVTQNMRDSADILGAWHMQPSHPQFVHPNT